MNYQRIYDQIIERAKTRKLEGYKERHHILPKCIGGTNEKDNIVELTAKEHFICHWLLHEMHPLHNGLAFAFWGMCNQKNKNQNGRYMPSSRVYEYARKLNSKFTSLTLKGRKTNPEATKKMVETRKANGSYIQTTEHRLKNSLANKGKKRSVEYSEKLSRRLKGVPKSETHVQNMKKPRLKALCPHCLKLGAINNKWHFDYCKYKK